MAAKAATEPVKEVLRPRSRYKLEVLRTMPNSNQFNCIFDTFLRTDTLPYHGISKEPIIPAHAIG